MAYSKAIEDKISVALLCHESMGSSAVIILPILNLVSSVGVNASQ